MVALAALLWPPALPGVRSACAAPAAATTAPDPNRTEFSGLPVLGYDSDLGIQFGAFATMTRFAPGYAPFRFRLEVLLSATLKIEAGTASVPFHDDHATLEMPGLLADRLRIQATVSWGRYSNSPWYGVGNGSIGDPPSAIVAAGEIPALRWFRYEHTYPRVEANTRWRLVRATTGPLPGRLDLLAGASATWNQLLIDPQSELGRELAIARGGGGPGDVAAHANILRGTGEHVLPTLRVGLVLEMRDHEFMSTRGIAGELAVRVSPAPDDLRHAGFSLSLTGLYPMLRDRLVLAAHLWGDLIVGDPPFYVLTGIGGESTVRGVPGGRFAGRAKVVANLEIRGWFPRFHVRKQRLRLGLACLADAGRAWADLKPVVVEGRNLDASSRVLATGLGGGLRLAWGEMVSMEKFRIRGKVSVKWTPSPSRTPESASARPL